MAREFTVVIERDEEGYLVASVPSLPGCHTQARSMETSSSASGKLSTCVSKYRVRKRESSSNSSAFSGSPCGRAT